MFGMAEDHDSNPIKMGLGRLKTRGQAKFVSINPVRTGYSAIADEWLGIRPGTDGLFVFALIHELLKAEKVDWRSEEHTSELQSLMRISYAVFCLKQKTS